MREGKRKQLIKITKVQQFVKPFEISRSQLEYLFDLYHGIRFNLFQRIFEDQTKDNAAQKERQITNQQEKTKPGMSHSVTCTITGKLDYTCRQSSRKTLEAIGILKKNARLYSL